MADTSMPKAAGFNLGKHIVAFLLVGSIGFSTALVFISKPQDLKDIGGYDISLKQPPARDIKAVLKNSLSRGHPIALTDSEINQWLGRTLITKQGGLLAGMVTLDRVLVRLEDNRAEVVMVRKIMGRPFTVSMFIKIEQKDTAKGLLTEVQLHGGPYCATIPQPPRGGRFGKLVVPQGFLLLVMPAYQRLATLFHDEIHLAFEEMVSIKIEKGRLVLSPLELSADQPKAPAVPPKTS